MRPAIEKTSSLDTHLSDVAGLRLRQRLPEHRHERQEVREAVRARTEDHHGDTGAQDVLLESEVAIHRDKNIKLACGQCEELAVLDSRPTEIARSADFVSGNSPRQSPVDTFVQ